MKTRITITILFLIAAALLGACGSQATPASTNTPEPTATPEATPVPGGVETALSLIVQPESDVVATVNGVAISTELYLGEVERQIRFITEQYGVDWSDPEMAATLTQVQDQMLQQLINLELVRQLGAAEGASVDEALLDQEMEASKAQILADGMYPDWEAFLEANGITEEYYRSRVEDSLLIDELVQRHGGDTIVEQVHAEHILVDDAETAQTVLDELAAGKTFEELAQEYSTDTGSKDIGGDLGWFPRGVMVEPFEEAAFSLEIGAVSEPIETDYGYHIIKVLGKEERPLEGTMLEEVQQQAFTDWFFEEKDKADIEQLFMLGE